MSFLLMVFYEYFDYLLTPPLEQNDSGSQHFYQLSEVSGGLIGQWSWMNQW